MIVGYARTSTIEQMAGLKAQEVQLRATGCTRLFAEQVSSVAQREQLSAALAFVRDGDTLIVTRLDRLARSTTDLLEIVGDLESKNVGLRVLDFGGAAIDTSSPTGRLMVTMFGALAQFERELMLQRQKEGIAKAKAEGRYKGRAPTARAKQREMRELRGAGLTVATVAQQLGVSRASVYRLLKDASK